VRGRPHARARAGGAGRTAGVARGRGEFSGAGLPLGVCCDARTQHNALSLAPVTSDTARKTPRHARSHTARPPRFRELGCVVTPAKGPDYQGGRSYTASLLPRASRGPTAAAPPKTLGECLPKPKGPPKARGR
jgi:hypothetical protein